LTWRKWLTTEWRPLLGIIVGAIIFVLFLAAIYNLHDHPTANEFCRGHGGVSYLDAGGFYSPPAATCKDGTAGQVWFR
jgi:hypothetical protein